MSRLDETVEDAEFIFEAVVEDVEIKKDLFESKIFVSIWYLVYIVAFQFVESCKTMWVQI